MYNKRLYKSVDDRMVFGVCGGVAEYFDVDPVLIRILMAVFALAGGSGVVFYIIAAIVMRPNPEESHAYYPGRDYSETKSADEVGAGYAGGERGAQQGYHSASQDPAQASQAQGYTQGHAQASPNGNASHSASSKNKSGNSRLIFGLILVLAGLLLLIQQYIPIFSWINGGVLFAIIIVVVGIVIISRNHD